MNRLCGRTSGCGLPCVFNDICILLLCVGNARKCATPMLPGAINWRTLSQTTSALRAVREERDTNRIRRSRGLNGQVNDNLLIAAALPNRRCTCSLSTVTPEPSASHNSAIRQECADITLTQSTTCRRCDSITFLHQLVLAGGQNSSRRRRGPVFRTDKLLVCAEEREERFISRLTGPRRVRRGRELPFKVGLQHHFTRSDWSALPHRSHGCHPLSGRPLYGLLNAACSQRTVNDRGTCVAREMNHLSLNCTRRSYDLIIVLISRPRKRCA